MNSASFSCAKTCFGLGLLLIAGLFSGCTAIDMAIKPPQTATTMDSQAQSQTEAWVRGLTGLTPARQGVEAEQAWRDVSRPQLLRDRAAFILSTRPSAQTLGAQQYLYTLYADADQDARVSMERLLMADLLTADAETLRNLGSSVPATQERNFPWSLTLWQAAKRNLVADSQAVLARLSDSALYADPTLVGLRAAGTATTLDPAQASAYGRVALLLPLSGNYGTVGKKIAAGAQVGKEILARRGLTMEVYSIDTENPAWVDEFAALPADCVTVGGPLRADSLALIQNNLQGRALFAFMAQTLEGEGRDYWRFFTTPKDQIDAVLDFTIGTLGIYSYGALAPEDSFGQGMTDIFLRVAGQRGVSVQTGTYPPADMAAWTKLTGEFVQTSPTERGKIPVAKAGFDAIFLPDVWKNMDMLISALQYNGAHRMVMLGTSLWEQGLSGAHGLNAATFGMSVFPGMWNAAATNQAARDFAAGMLERGQRPDDWSVLGFDFVQFAAALALSTPVAEPAQVNARLGAGLNLDWAGAPMAWDSFGKGFRRLFLFQPAKNGMVPLNPAAFSSYRSGSGPLPNAEAGEASPINRYDPERLEPALDDLVNSITGGVVPQAPQ